RPVSASCRGATRRGNAGPTIFTPEAQCLGAHAFDFAVMPYAGGWLDADVAGASARWRCPPLSVQGVTAPATAGAWLLRCGDPRIQVTAVKRHQERDTLIVRLCNLADETVALPLAFGRDVTGAWRSNLLEERGTGLAPDGDPRNRVTLDLSPHRIATIEVAFA
ncbi:hypothetical protein KKG45_05350, partial [bacterium]|nr:hypothetical protein [bacterium]